MQALDSRCGEALMVVARPSEGKGRKGNLVWLEERAGQLSIKKQSGIVPAENVCRRGAGDSPAS